MTWRDTPREVAAAADVVFSMVTDDAALRGDREGPDGILAGLGARQAVHRHEHRQPDGEPRARRPRRARARLAHMLDAPVSGSVPQAESGTLTIMVGGDPEAFAARRAAAARARTTVTHVGANGQGLLLKLAINISLAVQTLAFSEGVLLAERGGVDPDVAAEVMGRARSARRCSRPASRCSCTCPSTPGSTFSSMHKDIRLARQEGSASQTPLPTTAVADELLATSRRARLRTPRPGSPARSPIAHGARNQPAAGWPPDCPRRSGRAAEPRL